MKYTENIKQKVYYILSTENCSPTKLCRLLGIDRKTYFKWLQEEKSFTKIIKSARKEYFNKKTLDIESSLYKIALGYNKKGNNKHRKASFDAIKYILERNSKSENKAKPSPKLAINPVNNIKKKQKVEVRIITESKLKDKEKYNESVQKLVPEAKIVYLTKEEAKSLSKTDSKDDLIICLDIIGE